MSTLSIRVDRLGKEFRRGATHHGSLVDWLRGRRAYESFWALKDVSFEVPRGEMLGIVGPNGAGKSTLLSVLSRITRPTEGRAEVWGRVGSLLSVGTGFHAELTGRENVYLSGSLIGMRRDDIRRRLDRIIDFAGIGEFADTPIKRYSSGMRARLGFAVAANLRQEIMLVDEVLAVGDAAFREQSLAEMEQATSQGRTVLFVGHNLEMITASCSRVLWLDQGRIVADGDAARVVQDYQDTVLSHSFGERGFLSIERVEPLLGDESVRLIHVRLLDRSGAQVPGLTSGEAASIAIGYTCETGHRLREVTVGLTFHAGGQVPIASCDSSCVAVPFDDIPECGEFVCAFDKLALAPGRYKLGLTCKVDERTACSMPGVGRFNVAHGDFYRTGVEPPVGGGPALLDYSWSVDGE